MISMDLSSINIDGMVLLEDGTEYNVDGTFNR